MTEEQKAAYIHTQAVGALIQALGMMSENMQRHTAGQVMAYRDTDFANIENRFTIGTNDVLKFFHGG